MAATTLAGEVDRLDEHRQPLLHLGARARVDLAVRLDIGRVERAAGIELAAPVIRDARLDAVLVVIGDRVGAVAEPGQRELADVGIDRVVVFRVAVDDRVVQDDAETGFPQPVLDREFPAVDVGGLVAVERLAELEIEQIVLGQAEDVAVQQPGVTGARDLRGGREVAQDIIAHAEVVRRSQRRHRLAITRPRAGIAQVERGRVDLVRADEVLHVLVEVPDRNVALGTVIPFRRQIDVLRLEGKQVRVALAAGAAADARVGIDVQATLQAAVIGARDRVAVRGAQLHVAERFDVEIDRG